MKETRQIRIGLLAETRYLHQAQPAAMREALEAAGHDVIPIRAETRHFLTGDDGWLSGLDVVTIRGRSWPPRGRSLATSHRKSGRRATSTGPRGTHWAPGGSMHLEAGRALANDLRLLWTERGFSALQLAASRRQVRRLRHLAGRGESSIPDGIGFAPAARSTSEQDGRVECDGRRVRGRAIER